MENAKFFTNWRTPTFKLYVGDKVIIGAKDDGNGQPVGGRVCEVTHVADFYATAGGVEFDRRDGSCSPTAWKDSRGQRVYFHSHIESEEGNA